MQRQNHYNTVITIITLASESINPINLPKHAGLSKEITGNQGRENNSLAENVGTDLT